MNQNHEQYYSQLAMHLRGRRLPESRVSSILHDVAEGVRESGNDPEEEFGPPQDYAEKFPRGRATLARWIGYLVLPLVVIAVALLRLVNEQGTYSPNLFGVPAWIYVAGTIVVLIVVTALRETRMPRGFRASSDGTS